MNRLIVIRGTSATKNEIRVYLNVDEQEALDSFLNQFTYVSSEVVEFDQVLQVDTPDPFLRFRAVAPAEEHKPLISSKPTSYRIPWH